MNDTYFLLHRLSFRLAVAGETKLLSTLAFPWSIKQTSTFASTLFRSIFLKSFCLSEKFRKCRLIADLHANICPKTERETSLASSHEERDRTTRERRSRQKMFGVLRSELHIPRSEQRPLLRSAVVEKTVLSQTGFRRDSFRLLR